MVLALGVVGVSCDEFPASPGRHVGLVTAVAEDEANDFKLRQCSISLYFYLPKREHPPSAKKKLQTLHCTLMLSVDRVERSE